MIGYIVWGPNFRVHVVLKVTYPRGGQVLAAASGRRPLPKKSRPCGSLGVYSACSSCCGCAHARVLFFAHRSSDAATVYALCGVDLNLHPGQCVVSLRSRCRCDVLKAFGQSRMATSGVAIPLSQPARCVLLEAHVFLDTAASLYDVPVRVASSAWAGGGPFRGRDGRPGSLACIRRHLQQHWPGEHGHGRRRQGREGRRWCARLVWCQETWTATWTLSALRRTSFGFWRRRGGRLTRWIGRRQLC